MKYRDINWSLDINGYGASCDDAALDIIAEQLQQGYTSGTFTFDDTNYTRCDELKNLLEEKLGRNVDFSVECDDKGELDELLTIAKKHKDKYVINLITEILEIGFED